MLVCSATVFWPMQMIIDQLEKDGTVHTSMTGAPCFQDGDGRWYDTVAALGGLIDHCEMWARRSGTTAPTEALKVLRNRLKYDMPIDAPLLSKVKREVNLLQKVISLSDGEAMLDILTQVQIKIGFEKNGILEAS